MTKLEKIEEIIREYESGSDANVTAEDIIEGIKNTIAADDRCFDPEVTPRTVPSDEIDFDKELIFDSLSLKSDYADPSAEPYFESENSISWALTVNSSLERIFIERGGYDRDEFTVSVGDEYIEGLNPLDYDDIYAEHYLIVDTGKNITIENQLKRSGAEVTTCYDTVLSPSESKAFCGYIDKYLAQFNGRSIDSYFAEGSNLYLNDFEVENGVLIKYTGNEEHVVIPEGVTEIGEFAFGGQTGIIDVKLPSSLTKINKGAFCDCSNLKSITLPDSVTEIGDGAFVGCYSLNDVKLSNNLDEIPDEAFHFCRSLEHITIPDNVTYIGMSAFCSCDGLKSISLPKELDHIDDCAFAGCVSLEGVSIPNKTRVIGEAAFSDCRNIKNVILPDSVSGISSQTFLNCARLESVSLGAATVVENSNAFPRSCSVTRRNSEPQRQRNMKI